MAEATLTSLLDELAAWLAEQVGVAYRTAVAGRRGLFIHRMGEAADPLATVLRASGGPATGYDPTVQVALQILTQGPTEEAALGRAWAIHNSLLDAHCLPRRMWPLTTWRILRLDPQGLPAALGVLPGGGADVSQNWILQAVRMAAPRS